MIQIRSLYEDYVGQLRAFYPAPEAESLVLWLLEVFLDYKRSDLGRNVEIEQVPSGLLEAFLQLKNGKPIQYIIGKAPFYGREYLVNPSVLIPRNETEELVNWVLKENKSPNLSVLDIGTGSGCIAISLSLEMAEANVVGIDVSASALEAAERNNARLGANSSFFRRDILTHELNFSHLDIIVSNPPYVLDSEKSTMHPNVLRHEPHLALFVKDEDPLLFYRVIADKARYVLRKGGKLYFEINEAKEVEICKLLQHLGYNSVQSKSDINGKARMVRGIWEGIG